MNISRFITATSELMQSLTSLCAYEVIGQYYLLPVSFGPKTLMQRLLHITEAVMNVGIPGISQE